MAKVSAASFLLFTSNLANASPDRFNSDSLILDVDNESVSQLTVGVKLELELGASLDEMRSVG